MKKPLTKFPHDFVQQSLELMSEYLPGDTTINQLRIVHYISMCSVGGEGHTSHTEICSALAMPAATVTRAIAAFLESGILAEASDPRDARRRLVSMNRNFPQRDSFEGRLLKLAQRYFEPQLKPA